MDRKRGNRFPIKKSIWHNFFALLTALYNKRNKRFIDSCNSVISSFYILRKFSTAQMTNEMLSALFCITYVSLSLQYPRVISIGYDRNKFLVARQITFSNVKAILWLNVCKICIVLFTSSFINYLLTGVEIEWNYKYICLLDPPCKSY